MGELASFGGYTNDMDELGQELLWTTLELETLKSEAEAEIRKNKVYAENLIHLLKQAIQERDEARDQLQNLVNKTMLSSTTDRENSSTLSLDALSSPEFSNILSFLDRSSVQDAKNINRSSMIIDSIAKGRALPPKGKFMQAVLEAGPLLGTLLVAVVQPFEFPLGFFLNSDTGFFSLLVDGLWDVCSVFKYAAFYPSPRCVLSQQ